MCGEQAATGAGAERHWCGEQAALSVRAERHWWQQQWWQ